MIEKAKLDAKLVALISFFDTDTFRNLPVAEQNRLQQQKFYMAGYSQVLEARIAAF